MFIVLALLIVGGSVAACVARLRFVTHPTELDAATLGRELRRPGGRVRVEEAVAATPDGSWERELFDALQSPPGQRIGRVNEQLTELDYASQRWIRVPRVCASICTSSGFLLAAMTLRSSLVEGPEALLPGQVVDAAVMQAVNVAAIGLAGTAFCIATQLRARRAAEAGARAYDDLVQRLEGEAPGEGRGAAEPPQPGKAP